MKDHPLNFKVSDKTAKEFQEIMTDLQSDNQTLTQEIMIKVIHKMIKTEGIGKVISYAMAG